jgi:hypothetical protein
MKKYNAAKLTSITMIAFFILLGSACKKSGLDGSSATHAVSIFLTDDPSLVFDNLFIDVQKVEVKAEDSSEAENEREHEGEHDENDRNGSTEGGWVSLNITPGVYDLLKFRNGIDTILGTGNFPINKNLKKIRLTLGQNNSAVLNGATVPLVIKDKNNIIVINLEESLLSSNNGRFELSIDIDASRSVRQHGDEFELKPEVHGFNRIKSGSIEGKVLPAEAKAIVYAINGSDTISAMPEREGEFKIAGLKNGSYTLLIHPTANGYLDSSLPINVSGSEDTHVPTITLHK